MLVNTVILFLRDLLPIFMWICFLSVQTSIPKFSLRGQIYILIIALLLGIAYFSSLPELSQWFEGLGIELSQVMLLLVSILLLFVGVLLSYGKKSVNGYVSTIICSATVAFIVVKASVFIVYLDGYLLNASFSLNILIGLVLGFGICLSISFIMFYLFDWLNKTSAYFYTIFLFSMFISGHFAQITINLQQIDFFHASSPLWDSSWLIADNSEYGQFLKTLIGYEASPTALFLQVYIVSLVCIFTCLFYLEKSKRNQGAACGDTKNEI